MGRKSNATLAAEAAAKESAEAGSAEELAKIETVDGEVVVTDLEPASKEAELTETPTEPEAPVSSSVDPDGEDLGDVTNQPVETPVIEAGELVETVSTESTGDGVTEVTELPEGADLATMSIHDQVAALEKVDETEIGKETNDEIAKYVYEIPDGFVPILYPTYVGAERTGYISAPKVVFDLVQTNDWQILINTHPAKQGLISVLYWKRKNGKAVVRCMSSSRFADVN